MIGTVSDGVLLFLASNEGLCWEGGGRVVSNPAEMVPQLLPILLDTSLGKVACGTKLESSLSWSLTLCLCSCSNDCHWSFSPPPPRPCLFAFIIFLTAALSEALGHRLVEISTNELSGSERCSGVTGDNSVLPSKTGRYWCFNTRTQKTHLWLQLLGPSSLLLNTLRRSLDLNVFVVVYCYVLRLSKGRSSCLVRVDARESPWMRQ